MRNERSESPSLQQTLVEYLDSSGPCDPDLLNLLSDHPELVKRLRELLAAHERTVATIAPSVRVGDEDSRGETAGKLDHLEVPTILPTTSPAGGSESGVAPTLDGISRVGDVAAIGSRRFGDYLLKDEIARGGMGVIYRAHQISLDRPVALKMILSGNLAGVAEVSRFYKEAEAAAQLNHPGIVPIFEVGEQDGQHFFAMGLVDGCSLADRIVKGPLSNEEAAEIVRRVAEAVGYAHQRGVVHRDLKPANVLLDSDGTPLVTDFGIAKRVDKDSQLTNDGQVLGTPSFMPPEQASGDIENVGPTSDVYSIGAVLYACLTGRPPFQAATQLDTLMQVLERDPTPPSQFNSAVDQDLETICLKCMQKNPKERYASAAELVADLNRFQRGEPISARPISPFELLRRWQTRLKDHKTVRVHSSTGVAGLPWVDIAIGPDQQSGESQGVARGVVAIGDKALGVVALGRSARGFVAVGETSFGVFAVGTRAVGVAVFGAMGLGLVSVSAISIGVVAFGGIAIGHVAVGGVAMGIYSFGALVFGREVIGIGRSDPGAQEFFSSWIRWLFGRS